MVLTIPALPGLCNSLILQLPPFQLGTISATPGLAYNFPKALRPMAELIALGPAVIAVGQVADRVVGLCKHYIETVKDAPSDLRVILLETLTLKAILTDMELLSNTSSNPEQSSNNLQKPVEECRQLVESLESLFPSQICQTSKNSSKRVKAKATLTALAWPLKESKAKKLLDKLRLLKETITIELTSQSR